MTERRLIRLGGEGGQGPGEPGQPGKVMTIGPDGVTLDGEPVYDLAELIEEEPEPVDFSQYVDKELP